MDPIIQFLAAVELLRNFGTLKSISGEDILEMHSTGLNANVNLEPDRITYWIDGQRVEKGWWEEYVCNAADEYDQKIAEKVS